MLLLKMSKGDEMKISLHLEKDGQEMEEIIQKKELMVLEGHLDYIHHLHPSDQLSNSQRDFLHAQWKQFKNWWTSWDGNPKNMKEKTEEN